MGIDLVSACVFCAGLLLGMDLPPPAGMTAEIAGAYATLARRTTLPRSGLADTSDVTPKFVGVGVRGARQARENLGAGTPESEWRVRIALAPSHDEQTQRPVTEGRTVTTGTGRYENFALLYRHPLGRRDSGEFAWSRRIQKATDLVNSGGEKFELGEQRVLSAERVDLSLGWRHRRKDLEVAAAARYARPDSHNMTAGASYSSRGHLYGANIEGRFRRANWTFRLAAEAMEGDSSVREKSAPHFARRDFLADASFRAATLAAGYNWRKTEIFLAATYDRSHLPFVSLAVLGHETRLFDAGFHADSRTEETILDLSLRQSAGAQVKVLLFLRAVYGREKLRLTDSSGLLPAQDLTVERIGLIGPIGKGYPGLSFIGSPHFVAGVGAEFSLRRAPD